jgi:protein-disulfide isomerase
MFTKPSLLQRPVEAKEGFFMDAIPSFCARRTPGFDNVVRSFLGGDALFAATEELTAETLAEVAQNAECDLRQWNDDLSHAATKTKVDADIELGIRLGVPGTPTALLNGRPIPGGGKRYLHQLIEHIAEQPALASK